MDISKNIIFREMSEETAAEYFKRLAQGDPRCRIPVGSRVRKVFAFSPNDEINPIGSEGTVVGSTYRVEPEYTEYGVNHDMYLVNFDNALSIASVKIKSTEKIHLAKFGFSAGITTACHGVKLMKL